MTRKRKANHYDYTRQAKAEPDKPAWLSLFLQTTVPLAIVEIQRRGGPNDQDFAEAREFGCELVERGDRLMYQEKDTYRMVAKLAYAIATASFVPGGVQVLGVRYEARCQPT